MSALGLKRKALRLLAEGRLQIVAVAPGNVEAEITGKTPYRVTFDGSSWACSCPATRVCSHLFCVGNLIRIPESEVVPEPLEVQAAPRPALEDDHARALLARLRRIGTEAGVS
jgi:hypothetical protein